MKRVLGKFGPGLLVTAAFIGPGTVTTASRAGADAGFALLWAIVFATAATIVLQEMAARLGLVCRQGLGEAIRSSFVAPPMRLLSCTLVIAAIGVGNGAYQTGNLTGAAIGLEVLSGIDRPVWISILAAITFALLFGGRYKLIEFVLIALVVLMSLVFLLTAILVCPDLTAVAQGMVVPKLPTGTLAVVIGLIGTTVVPYNLFLHASSVREKWPQTMPVDQALAESRWDTVVSISVGGLITLAIVTTAAAAFYGTASRPDSAADMALQLEPLLGGPTASIFFAIGLFAAGFTSSITAPLAAAYATAGILGWPADLRSWRFRAVWLAVLAAGLVVSLTLGQSPTEIILAAQVANGLLLPVIVLFLLVAVNRGDLMGNYRNRLATNLLGGAVVLVTTGLGVWSIAGGR